jgi:UDP-GlcNAc3NAcA epimerase
MLRLCGSECLRHVVGSLGDLVKLLTIVGARPQFIKAAVLSHTIAEYNGIAGHRRIDEVLVHTGQHFDFNMSELFFVELGLPAPAYHLGIGGLRHGAMTGRMLEMIDEVLERDRPDAVLVYGDTNSTLAGALAAAKLHIPLAHVEAGVRSFNRRMPEEINRVVTDQLSQWLFCPTATAVENLRREGLESGRRVEVQQVGDVMYDASLMYRSCASPTPAIADLLDQLMPDYYVATVHREENTGEAGGGAERLLTIVATLDRIAEHTPVALPVHPRIRSAITRLSPKNIRILEPIGYFDMMALIAGCRAVITDSGGLQKEAYFFGKPCIILREETEWTELVIRGWSVLAGAEAARILEAERHVRGLTLSLPREKLYGQGDAAKRIVEILGAATW